MTKSDPPTFDETYAAFRREHGPPGTPIEGTPTVATVDNRNALGDALNLLELVIGSREVYAAAARALGADAGAPVPSEDVCLERLEAARTELACLGGADQLTGARSATEKIRLLGNLAGLVGLRPEIDLTDPSNPRLTVVTAAELEGYQIPPEADDG